jgi:hypothetical protein
MISTVPKIKSFLEKVRKHTQADVFLFGSTLRKLVSEDVVDVLDVCININDSDTKKAILSESDGNFNVIFGEVDYTHEYFTFDNVYCKLPDNFDGNIELLSSNNGLIDLNKRIIKLTKAGKSKLAADPTFIFDIIMLSVNCKFILDSLTISAILQTRSIVKSVGDKYVCDFLRNILSSKYPRKMVAMMNTLGISNELFGANLYETSIVNHLKPEDFYEFVAVIFSHIDVNDVKKYLTCFSPKDVEIISNIILAISLIEEENAYTARLMLKTTNKSRIQSLIRLLYAMKFKNLVKHVRAERDGVCDYDSLCVDEKILKQTFKNINEAEVKLLLDKALNKVLLNPEYNNVYKMLTYLNSERK